MDLTTLLPTDLLALIFEFFPLLPRIRVVSFVSKRWCVAARLSIKSIKGVEIYNASLALAHLPCVTSLAPQNQLSCDLSACTSLTSFSAYMRAELVGTLALPPSLIALRLVPDYSAALLVPLMRPLTRLTRLHLRHAVPLGELPHLAHLTDLDTGFGAPLSFIGAHASQLTSLGLRLWDEEAEGQRFAETPFLRLHTLRLRSGRYDLRDGTELFLRNCPALTALHLCLHSPEAHETLPDVLKPLVVYLSMGGEYGDADLTPRLAKSLESFPRLVRLKLSGMLHTHNHDAPLVTQLCALSVCGLDTLVSLSRQSAFYAIHKLSLEVKATDTAAVLSGSGVSLTHLRKLELSAPRDAALETLVSIGRALVCLAPALSKLYLSWNQHEHVLTALGWCNLARFLYLLNTRGVRQVEFADGISRSLPKEIAPHLPCLRLVSVLSAAPAQGDAARSGSLLGELDAVLRGSEEEGAWTVPR